MYFKCKSAEISNLRFLLSVYVPIPDDYPSLGSKLAD